MLLLGCADGEATSFCNAQLSFCSPMLRSHNRYCVNFPASEDIYEFRLLYAWVLKTWPFMDICLLPRKVFQIINHLILR